MRIHLFLFFWRVPIKCFKIQQSTCKLGHHINAMTLLVQSTNKPPTHNKTCHKYTKSLMFIHRPQTHSYTPRPNIRRRATPVIPAVCIRTQLSAQICLFECCIRTCLTILSSHFVIVCSQREGQSFGLFRVCHSLLYLSLLCCSFRVMSSSKLR